MIWLTLGVCLAAYVLLGKEVVVTAVKNLARGRMLDENFLMALASIGAFFTGSFTEAVGVMLFYRVGEYFEDRAVARSRSQISPKCSSTSPTANRAAPTRSGFRSSASSPPCS